MLAGIIVKYAIGCEEVDLKGVERPGRRGGAVALFTGDTLGSP
jgi:hypothetical protein